MLPSSKKKTNKVTYTRTNNVFKLMEYHKQLNLKIYLEIDVTGI